MSMAAIVLLALTLPLAGVLWSADRMLKAHRTPAPSGGGEALRAALEEVATRTLAPAALGDPAVTVEASDFDLELARLAGLAQRCGGHAVTTFRDERQARVAVQVPAERVKEFVGAVASSAPQPAEPGSMVTVVLRKPEGLK